MNYKVCAKKWLLLYLVYHPENFQEGLSKIMNFLRLCRQCPGRKSNHVPSECKSEAIAL
jgi:hypothetical protein